MKKVSPFYNAYNVLSSIKATSEAQFMKKIKQHGG